MMISQSSNKSGGSEGDFFRILKHLKNKYYIISVFPDGNRDNMFKNYSDEYLIIPDKIFPFDKFSFKGYYFYLKFSYKKFFILYPFLKKLKKDVDICFVNSSVCVIEMILLNILRIPYVISIKEVIEPALARFIIYKFVIGNARKVIVISEYLKTLYTKVNKNDSPVIIRSAIDGDLLGELKQQMLKDAKINRNNFVIINIGVIHPLKNQMLLLKSLSNINNDISMKVKFIGPIRDLKYYNTLVEYTNKFIPKTIEVSFTNDMENKDVLKEIFNSHCVVITSKKEGMSLVFAEALFMEKPVISTKVGVMPEIIVDGENGFLINDDDYSRLSECLNVIENDRDLFRDKLFGMQSNNFDLNYYNAKHEEVIVSNC